MKELFSAPLYLLFGIRPVKSERDAEGNLLIYAYETESGKFEINMSYLKRMYTRRDDEEDDITELNKEEFENYVKNLRQKP